MDKKGMQLIILSQGERMTEDLCKALSRGKFEYSVMIVDTVREAAELMCGSGEEVLPGMRHAASYRDRMRVGKNMGLMLADRRGKACGEPDTQTGGSGKDGARKETGVALPEKGDADAEVTFIRYYVRMHLSEELNLNRLSHIIGLSPNYLCTVFRRKTGMGLGTFIRISRLEKAAYLLETEASYVEDIASRVGFTNSSYFCKLFKKHYGMTPRRFRIRLRNGVETEDDDL